MQEIQVDESGSDSAGRTAQPSTTRDIPLNCVNINSELDNLWNKAVLILSESLEVKSNDSKILTLLNPNAKYEIESGKIHYNFQDPVQLYSTLTDYVQVWRNANERENNRTIHNFTKLLLSHKFVNTASSVGALITNNGNSIKFYHSTPQKLNAFYGRKHELNSLLAEVSTLDITQINLIVITGTFGIGKSSFAKEFGNICYQQFGVNVIWINGEGPITIEREFKALASALSIRVFERSLKKIIEDCYNYFEYTKSLFIFDNVENFAEIAPFLPSSIQKLNSFKPLILITSRDGYSWTGKTILSLTLNLDVLSDEDSLEFLEKELQSLNPTPVQNDLRRLAIELDYYPQVMRHVCAFILNLDSDSPIFDFFSLYQQENEKLRRTLENHTFEKGNDCASNLLDDKHTLSLYASWKLIFPKLLDTSFIAQLDQEIQYKVLILIAFASPDYIPKILLRDLYDCETCENILTQLETYSIIYSRDEYFTIHRAVQKVFRQFLPTDMGEGKLVSAFESLIQDVNHLLQPNKYKTAKYKDIKTFFPTFENITNYIIKMGLLQNQIQFVQNVWHFLNVMEYYNEAYEYSNKTYKHLCEVLNPTDIRLLQINYYVELSKLLFYREEGNDAYVSLKVLYDECQKPHFGRKHPLTLEIGTHFAFTLGRLYRFDESVAVYNEILEFTTHNPLLRIIARSGLAETQKRMGNYEESEVNFKSALQDAIMNLGLDHYQTQKTQYLMCIASIHVHNLLPEAFVIMKSMKDFIFKSLGYKQFLTLKTFYLYSMILNRLGKYEEAEKTINEIEPYATHVVSSNHSIILALRENKFIVKLKQGKVTEMETIEVLRENLKIKSDNNQFNIMDTMENLAELYFDKKKFPEAKVAYENLYEYQLKLFSENNQLVKNTKIRLDKIEEEINLGLIQQSLESNESKIQCSQCPEVLSNQKTYFYHIREMHGRAKLDKPDSFL